MRLLPAQRRWVQTVCEHLIDGEIVVVRGVPGSGKTTLLRSVARELGDTSVTTLGRSYTEQDQDECSEDFRARVRAALDRHGTAHLLFDDYPHALRRTRGVMLQRQLLHLLVDGEHALDVGALFTGRWARSMHLVSSGSPLVARARGVPLPTVAEEDFEAVHCAGAQGVVEAVGGNAALLARTAVVMGRPVLHQVHETAAALAARWVDDVPWEAVRWMTQVVRDGPAALPEDDSATEALAPLVFPVGGGRYDVVRALRADAARTALEGRAPTWPDRWEESVATFCELLSGVPEVVWVDRYLTSDTPELLRFVQDVRATCGTRIRLLIAADQADRLDAATVAAFAALDCTIRLMHRGDRRRLHDRQLIFLGDLRGGVVMPTGRVVLCQDPPGSAVAVRAPLLDRKLILEAWGRAGTP
ncbi:ATP-binding protein [Streptomyces roseolilacinus]|uniref:ATP-binding protein n=1 Tax=Streptomyces roseolilacinus TaxID=66904 RepID=UPI003829C748